MKNLLVTVSGGRSSAMMARHIQTHESYKEYQKIYVFANTGSERPETINFLKNIVKYWGIDLLMVEAKTSNKMGVGVTYNLIDGFENLNMNNKPFERVIEHKTKGDFNGLPNQKAPYCSEMMKTIPSKKLADKIFGVNNYITSIGFRKEDMPKRITWTEIKELEGKKIFPLLTDWERPIGQLELTKWWNEQLFKLEIDGIYGNCDLCWKKSDKNIVKNIIKGTDKIDWWIEMEKKYQSTSFRGNRSILDMVELAEQTIKQVNPFEGELYKNDIDGDSCVCNF